MFYITVSYVSHSVSLPSKLFIMQTMPTHVKSRLFVTCPFNLFPRGRLDYWILVQQLGLNFEAMTPSKQRATIEYLRQVHRKSFLKFSLRSLGIKACLVTQHHVLMVVRCQFMNLNKTTKECCPTYCTNRTSDIVENFQDFAVGPWNFFSSRCTWCL